MRYFTYTMTGAQTITISAADWVNFISVICGTTGSCDVLGDLPFQGLTPTAVTLSAGQGVNLGTYLSSSPLDGVTITWVAGSVDVIIGR